MSEYENIDSWFWDDEETKAMCNGCQEKSEMTRPIQYHMWARSDAYGIYTGLYCDTCYKDSNIYTYRKDEYFDPAYAGERMDEDY
tara:strand:- start:563 stop:817 length:255 start_codon:yes stop_codon:yes gene_type:complete